MCQQRLAAAIMVGQLTLAQQRVKMAVAAMAHPQDRRQALDAIVALAIARLAVQRTRYQMMLGQGRPSRAQLAALRPRGRRQLGHGHLA